MGIDDEASAMIAEAGGDQSLERDSVGVEETVEERGPYLGAQGLPQRATVGRLRVDGTRADACHDLLLVIWESLRINDEATAAVDEHRPAVGRRHLEQHVGEPVGHSQQLGAKFEVVHQQRLPNRRRNLRGAVGNMDDRRRGRPEVGREDLERTIPGARHVTASRTSADGRSRHLRCSGGSGARHSKSSPRKRW